MSRSVLKDIVGKRGLIAAAMVAALSFASPAAAQLHSDGFNFLDAVAKRKTATVREFLDRPGSTLINSRDLSTNRTALHIVVEQRNEAWLRMLLQRGADPNLADNKGMTPLLLACRNGFIAGVEALVKAGARVDEPNTAGETPLITAVHSRDTALIRALLEGGANPDRADNTGRSARDYAKLEGAQSLTLAEIERSAKAGAQGRASAGVYGPVLRR